jgi:FtsZ-interacting cell division protein ZipA
MTTAILAVIGYIALIAIVLAALRKMNGSDTDAQEAADSVRAALESDARLDELRTYTQRPHVRANTAYGKVIK